MKERPILFSAPMIRAILDGTKTQTRRVVKFPARWEHDCAMRDAMDGKRDAPPWPHCLGENGRYNKQPCPYGQPGDTLWCRETFAEVATPSRDEDPEEFKRERRGIQYRADWDDPSEFPLPWTPSIFMPRRASRITLEVVSVRVERLQDISNEDAVAEGLTPSNGFPGLYMTPQGNHGEPKVAYMRLWESINGIGSWSKNDWVWVISFTRK